MKQNTKLAILLGIGLSLLLALSSLGWASASGETEVEAAPVTTTTTTEPSQILHESVRQRDAEAFNAVQFERYANFMHMVAVVEYTEAVEAEIARQEAAERAERQRREAERQKAAQKATTSHTASHSAPAPSGDDWYRLAGCETGGKYDNPNTGNGYYGYFQFDLPTWQSVGGPGYPHHHSYETQKSYAQKLHARRGWAPWPYCSRKLGLR